MYKIIIGCYMASEDGENFDYFTKDIPCKMLDEAQRIADGYRVGEPDEVFEDGSFSYVDFVKISEKLY